MPTSPPRRRVAAHPQISTIEQADTPGRAELARAWARSHGPQRENGKRGRGALVTAEPFGRVVTRLAGGVSGRERG